MYAPGVFTDEAAVDRLTQLGLIPEDFFRAVRAALTAFRNCDDDHPPYFPGINAHAQAVHSLRQGLRPRGWERQMHGGVALTVDPARGIALGVTTGDENTGDPNASPRTKNRKGSGTESVVIQNTRQLELFGPTIPQIVPPSGPDVAKLSINGREYTTFYLMYRLAENSDLVKLEVSMPKAFDDGWIVSWQERILLPDLDLKPRPVFEEGGGPGGGDSPIVVEVSRKV